MSGRSRQPNVLLITADQLRHDCVGYSGVYPVSTPHLDALASQSVVFTQAYSPIPVCGPARQALLAGRRAETFGALWNAGGALPVASLSPDAFTWTKALADLGYASSFLGKWSVHPSLDATSFGYDAYIGEAEYRRYAEELFPDVRFTGGFFGETNPIPVEHARTHWLAGKAVRELERLAAGGRPWHLALHFPEPHLPCRPSGRFASMYDPASVPEWAGFRETFADKPYIQRQQLYNWGVESWTWRQWAPVVARYYGVISQMDEAVGIVLSALESIGEADRTIVVFTADHGDLCGSHRMMDKHYILYDDVVRVPLLIRLPERRGREGVRCEKFVYPFLDLAPTLLEMLGVDPPERLHGRSLLPLLAGEEPDDWRTFVVSTYNGQQFGLYTQRMIRTDRWKYVWNTTDVDELYDLTLDPGELVNRIGDPANAELVAQLRRELYGQLAADGDALVANEWMRHQLLDGAKLGPR